jgi:hypothetical protein
MRCRRVKRTTPYRRIYDQHDPSIPKGNWRHGSCGRNCITPFPPSKNMMTVTPVENLRMFGFIVESRRPLY